jgi:uncharacterized protein (TIGR03435 family)
MATVSRPVIDQTGLDGTFDFDLEWLPEMEPGASADESGVSFREALKQELGLRLVPEKGPVELLVIDSVEQPTAN